MNIRSLIYSALIAFMPFASVLAQTSPNYVPVQSLSVLGNTSGPYYLYPALKPLVIVLNVGPYYYASSCPGTPDGYWYVAASVGCYARETPTPAPYKSAVTTQTTNYTVLQGVSYVPVDTTTGQVIITVPESLGTAANPYDVLVCKTNSGSNAVEISPDGTTAYAYIISQNDAGGAGCLTVQVNGSSMLVYGSP